MTEPERLPPLLHVIFEALKERGWTITDGVPVFEPTGRNTGGYVDPEGNVHGTLEAAITAQTFREIAEAR